MKLVPDHSTPLRHAANLVLWVLLAVSLPTMLEYVVYQVTPFGFNLRYTEHEYQDVCVGDTIQKVLTARDIVPGEGYSAVIKGELFKVNNGVLEETFIRRNTKFTYQPNNNIKFLFDIAWLDYSQNPPVPYTFTEPGEFAAGELITINPFPFVTKTKYYPPEEQMFRVVKCSNETTNTNNGT